MQADGGEVQRLTFDAGDERAPGEDGRPGQP